MKNNKWILTPYFKFDRTYILSVRESYHSVMIWDKKYYDIDECKFITDKLLTIHSYTLSDISEIEREKSIYTPKYCDRKYINKWFIPPDDDWID